MEHAWPLAVGMSLAIVAACGKGPPKSKSSDELKTEYGARMEPRLAKLYAAKEANEFASDANVPNIVVHVGTDTLVAEATDLVKEPNRRNTDRYDQTSEPGLFPLDDNPVFNARSLAGSEKGYISATDEPDYKLVLEAKYVLIVNTQWDSYGAAAGGVSTFVPFKVHGRATLAEIETAKPLGGFEFSATNSPELTSRTYTSPASGTTNDAQRVVREDFVKQYRAAISSGIKTRWPGSTTTL